jgi:hypothetical protein
MIKVLEIVLSICKIGMFVSFILMVYYIGVFVGMLKMIP